MIASFENAALGIRCKTMKSSDRYRTHLGVESAMALRRVLAYKERKRLTWLENDQGSEPGTCDAGLRCSELEAIVEIHPNLIAEDPLLNEKNTLNFNREHDIKS